MCFKILAMSLAMLVISDLIQPHQGLEVPDVVKKQVKKVHARCINQTGVSEEMVATAHMGELPTDPNFKCFLHCMFEMFGLIDSNHQMHLDALLEVLPEDIHPRITALVNACGSTPGGDGCDTAFQAVKCYLEVDGPFIKECVDVILG